MNHIRCPHGKPITLDCMVCAKMFSIGDRLHAYHERAEIMRLSILEWVNGEKSTKEGWIQPHGWKELRKALQNMEPMT